MKASYYHNNKTLRRQRHTEDLINQLEDECMLALFVGDVTDDLAHDAIDSLYVLYPQW